MIKTYLSRRENIILTSIEIINELGIQGLTIRELAKRQEVTEAAIYRHFKSKNEIVACVIEQFSNFDNTIKNVILEQNMNLKDGILFFIKSYSEYYENYPALAAIMFAYESLRNENELAEKMEQIYYCRYNFLLEFIENRGEWGDEKKEIAKESFVHTILGIMREVIFWWRLNNYNFSLKEKMLEAVELFLK